jgi:hypothetical protein
VSDEPITPGVVVAAAAILAAQGVFGTIAGIASLSQVDTSLLGAVFVLAVGGLAVFTAVMLVALRPWARVSAIALEAVGLFAWLAWAPLTPVRALVGAAVAAPVIVLLVIPAAEAAFTTAARLRRRR